jgi:hypothetical protein
MKRLSTRRTKRQATTRVAYTPHPVDLNAAAVAAVLVSRLARRAMISELHATVAAELNGLLRQEEVVNG